MNESARDGAGAIDARIERGMRELASWPENACGGKTPWQAAIAVAGASVGSGRLHAGGRGFSRGSIRRAAPFAACVIFVLLAGGALLPSLGRVRSRPPATVESSVQARAEAGEGRAVLGYAGRPIHAAESPLPSTSVASALGEAAVLGQEIARLRAPMYEAERKQPTSLDSQPPDVGMVSRQVVKTAVMALETEDVAGTIGRVVAIASEAHAEYVERSSMSGEDENARGEVVLRVTAGRLDQALASLRLLGKVTAETVSGEDVTAQVVDVEARLHNERRVETELLDLFDKRADAPLRDVLDLRDKLREVRLEIEQLVAQRDGLARLVALSTVTVSVQARAEEEKEEAGFFKPLSSRIARSWEDGLTGLHDSIAWMVRVAVGGLVWWIAIAAAVFAWRRWVRVKHLPA